jgi:hypothetical protein
MYPYCRIYQKQYTCPTLVLGQAKQWQRTVLEIENFRQIKWRIVIKTMCILWEELIHNIVSCGFKDLLLLLLLFPFAAGFDLFSSIFWTLEFVFSSGREELLQVGG